MKRSAVWAAASAAAALAALLAEMTRRGTDGKGTLPKPHHAPKAKAVIQLFMHGGPSHVDLLDPKPMLDKYDGKPPPAEVADDEKLTGNLLRSPFKFAQARQVGHCEFSETLPHIAGHADDIAVIRSMFTEHRNHEQALWMMHTGLTVAGPAEPRRVGRVRPRHREPEPARLRGAARPEGAAGGRHPQLVAAAGCRRCTRARSSAPRAARC